MKSLARGGAEAAEKRVWVEGIALRELRVSA